MFRYLLTITLLLTLLIDLSARERDRNKGFEFFETLHNPDEDKDLEVDTSELRTWAKAVSEVYESKHGLMRTEFFDLSFVKEFDENEDKKLSSSEERALRDHFKEIFDNASEAILKKYDANDNSRLDSKEILVARESVRNFLTFARKYDEEKEEREEQEREAKEKMKEELAEKAREAAKRKLDEIYD